MNSKTIKYYWDCLNICSKNLFIKVWETTNVHYSFFQKLSVHDNSYKFKRNLKLISKTQSIFPGSYYNIFFKIK